ncbi:MAG: homoserine O-acetyltransferase [Solirubrobacteraceae bacterium]|nr:homoserine O-acetyltransferase [Solirubrobacteraceae bacterium]
MTDRSSQRRGGAGLPGAAPPAGGVGPVQSKRVVVATPDHPLLLACGRALDHVEVAYETYGTLNPARDNAIYLCHALTAGCHAAGVCADTGELGWWDRMVGPGRAIDTNRWFVVCGNLLGSCLGTTGPSSIDPATGVPYGLTFPPIHIADQVAVHRRLCAALGVDELHAVVGPSIGGMQALQWMLDAPEQIARMLLIATTGRLTTENRAFSAAGRQAILDDPGFEGGRYLEGKGPGPERGLAAARRFAHITYVSAEALDAKLGDEPPAAWPPPAADAWLAPSREVERYLEYQGTSFVRRFDALSYLYLTRPMDDFDPFGAEHSSAARGAFARRPDAEFTVVSFDSDWRFGTDHSVRLAGALREHGARHVDRFELHTPLGHDAFLLEVPGLEGIVRDALEAPSTSS